MVDRSLIAAIALVVALCATTAEIRAWDDSKYPDLKGQWVRAPGGGARYDWSKPAGRGQEVAQPGHPHRAEHAGRLGGHSRCRRLRSLLGVGHRDTPSIAAIMSWSRQPRGTSATTRPLRPSFAGE